MKRAEIELAEGVALGKKDDHEDQVNEVKVDYEIEKRCTAVGEEDAGDRGGLGGGLAEVGLGGGLTGNGLGVGLTIGGLGRGFFDGREEEAETAKGEEAERKRGRVFVDVKERHQRENLLGLPGPDFGVVVADGEAKDDEQRKGGESCAQEESSSIRGRSFEPTGGDETGEHNAKPGKDGIGDNDQQVGARLK